MYAPTQVESLSFEMRSAKTGETLWQARQSASERNFGFTRRELEMKSFQDYEAAIGEIFQKVMKTFPEWTGYDGLSRGWAGIPEVRNLYAESESAS